MCTAHMMCYFGRFSINNYLHQTQGYSYLLKTSQNNIFCFWWHTLYGTLRDWKTPPKVFTIHVGYCSLAGVHHSQVWIFLYMMLLSWRSYALACHWWRPGRGLVSVHYLVAGTPDVTAASSEDSPSATAHWDFRKSLIQSWHWPFMP